MPERNTPQKTLESWKQIAAYLDRSERTVRRWEASEGLPVHRREHEKQDTVFAYRHEIEAWTPFTHQVSRPNRNRGSRESCRRSSRPPTPTLSNMTRLPAPCTATLPGARAGDGDLMRAAFHPSATISGYCQGVEYSGSVEHVFQWINRERPGSEYQPSLCAHRDHRDDRRRSSGSSALVGQVGGRQCASFRRVHPAQVQRRVEDHA